MKEVKELFNQVAEKLGYETHGRPAIREGEVYAIDWLSLNLNSVYGGYRMEIVLTRSGHQDFDGMGRKTNKEMIAYLRGLLKGLELQKKLDN